MEDVVIQRDWNNASTESINLTEVDPDPFAALRKKKYQLTLQYLAPFMLISVLNIFANGIILHAVSFSKTFHRPVNYMLGNLAFISIFRMVIACIVYLESLDIIEFTSAFACGIYAVVRRAYVSAEDFTVVCLSIDRSRVIRNPWDKESGKTALRKIFATWVISLFVEFPRCFFWRFGEARVDIVVTKCHNDKILYGSVYPWVGYVSGHFLLVSFLPSIVLGKVLMDLVRERYSLVSSCTAQKPFTPCQKIQQRLFRNGIIFIAVFLLIKFPMEIWYALWSLPQQFFETRAKNFFLYSRGPMGVVSYFFASFFPFLAFSLSHELRRYCYKCQIWNRKTGQQSEVAPDSTLQSGS